MGEMSESKSQRGSFPVKLYELVEGESGKRDEEIVVTWCEGGLAFIVRDMTRFCEEVLPQHFCHNKWASFIRQLNLYGFRRITQGQSSGAYWHKYFQRGQPHLLRGISRSRRGAGQAGFGATPEDPGDDGFRRLPGPTLGNAQPSVNPGWRQSSAPPLQSIASLPPPPIISDEALLRELDTLVQQQKIAQEKLASPSPASSAGSIGTYSKRSANAPATTSPQISQRPAVVVVQPPSQDQRLSSDDSERRKSHHRRSSDGFGTDDATVVAVNEHSNQDRDPTPVSTVTQIQIANSTRDAYGLKQNGAYPIPPLVSTKELSPSFEKLAGLTADLTKQQHESALLSQRKRIASHQSVHSVGSHDNMTEIGGHPLQKRENTTRRTTSKSSLASDDWDLNIADVDSLNLDEWRWNDAQNNDAMRPGNFSRQDSRTGISFHSDRINMGDIPRSDSLRFAAFTNNRSFTSPEPTTETAPVL